MTENSRVALVIDNEDGFHQILRLVLEPFGFVVESAYDGEQGLEKFKSRNYALVISDVHMPKIQGPALFNHIRNLRPDQPIIMMTSGSDPEGKFETGIRGMKFAECIYKPFEITEVVKAVESVLEISLEGSR